MNVASRCVSLQHSLLARWRSLEGFERWAWVMVLIWWGIGDTASTRLMLDAGAVEANPVVAGLISGGGIPSLAVAKGVGLLTVWAFWRWSRPTDVDDRSFQQRGRAVLSLALVTVAMLGMGATLNNMAVVVGWL